MLVAAVATDTMQMNAPERQMPESSLKQRSRLEMPSVHWLSVTLGCYDKGLGEASLEWGMVTDFNAEKRRREES